MKAAFAAYKYRQNNVKVQQNVAHIKVIQRNELNYRILHLHTSLYRIHTKPPYFFAKAALRIQRKSKRKRNNASGFNVTKQSHADFWFICNIWQPTSLLVK